MIVNKWNMDLNKSHWAISDFMKSAPTLTDTPRKYYQC